MEDIDAEDAGVGTISTLGDGRYEWTVEDFHYILKDNKYDILSPSFSFADQRWYLEFCTKAIISDYWVELVFTNETFELVYPTLHVKLGMRTGYRGKLETRSGKTGEMGIFNVPMWMPWSEMLQRRNEILCNGCLRVLCEVRLVNIGENIQVQREQFLKMEIDEEKNEVSDSDSSDEQTCLKSKTVEKAQDDLENLLISGEDSDVTIKVQGKEFPAHRRILQARCIAFKSMFSHDMIEKESGVVVIDDCDPVTFPDFLKYIYTGSTEHMSDRNVFSLYTISDKYCLDELKAVCVLFMKNCLSINTFCDVITIASRHDAQELIRLATDFFCNNALEIAKMPKWETFLCENPKAGNELFIKALSANKDIIIALSKRNRSK